MPCTYDTMDRCTRCTVRRKDRLWFDSKSGHKAYCPKAGPRYGGKRLLCTCGLNRIAELIVQVDACRRETDDEIQFEQLEMLHEEEERKSRS